MPRGTAPNIKYSYDPETRDWGFVVKRPHVVGGGDPTRAAAEQHAATAIALTEQVLREERGARPVRRAASSHTRRAG